MIVGGYTLDLYCDDPDHVPVHGESHQFFTEEGSQARRKARKAGWMLNLRDGVARCPACAKKAKTPQRVSHQRAEKTTVGTSVAFELGGTTVTGIVIEDRGPIGPGGLRLFRVRACLDDVIEPLEADVREDQLISNMAKTTNP
jgi:hypothetical protein